MDDYRQPDTPETANEVEMLLDQQAEQAVPSETSADMKAEDSREFADATQKPCAADYLTRCAEAMALTTADILCDPQLLQAIQEEFHNSNPTPFEAPAEAD